MTCWSRTTTLYDAGGFKRFALPEFKSYAAPIVILGVGDARNLANRKTVRAAGIGSRVSIYRVMSESPRLQPKSPPAPKGALPGIWRTFGQFAHRFCGPLVGPVRWPTFAAAIDLLYPPHCVACDGPIETESTNANNLCVACHDELSTMRRAYCFRCGTTRWGNDLQPCATCEATRFHFDYALRWGPYERPLRDYVLRMKHVADEPLARGLGQMLAVAAAQEMKSLGFTPDLVAPVPMHWLRRIVRRTSSAELLATIAARNLHAKFSRRLFVRQRNTQPQGELSPRDRRANVRNAFRLRRPSQVAGRKLLLVDDVLTTGATLNELARILRRADAAEIAVLVVARTEGTFS